MAENVIAEPTYMEHIRHFFDEIDLDHMAAQGVDLSTYSLLSQRASDVYLHTLQPDGDMPPDPGRRWSAERSATFLNWITNGLPIGVPTAEPVQTIVAQRIRKDARDLSAAELTTLTTAFRGIMDRDPSEPTSYFALAGTHWFPPPNECKHHEDRYQPWHRVFVTRFEDALRSVDGCGDVTLPYWDITAEPPEFLFAPPFDAYTAPVDIMLPDYPAGYRTIRFDASTIAANVVAFDIPSLIASATQNFRWDRFNKGIWQAHDAGHPACGTTMSTPDAAAFDPIFWFFHANWDRLWHEWQQIMRATTYWSFRSALFTSPAFLQAPAQQTGTLHRGDREPDNQPGGERRRLRAARHTGRATGGGARGLRQHDDGRAGTGAIGPARVGSAEGHRPAGDPGDLPGVAQG
ncbi:MAG: tyrosinase family protein [Pseudonocardiales bacterium]|nr:tyrosinase family protein [Pseudonocardiales bacterium]